MNGADALLLHLGVGAAAFLYSAVGHGGASAYLAVMAFLAVPRRDAATAALVLNLLVSAASLRAYLAQGRFEPRLVLPFCLLSVPAAWLGASWRLDERVYELLLALVLGAAAARLWTGEAQGEARFCRPPDAALALPVGAGIGLLSGMLGIGGGVILSPLLILRRWADPKTAAGASAFFILVNSAAGLASRASSGQAVTALPLLPLAATAFVSGWAGARAASRDWTTRRLRRALATVLLIANAKLLAGQ